MNTLTVWTLIFGSVIQSQSRIRISFSLFYGTWQKEPAQRTRQLFEIYLVREEVYSCLGGFLVLQEGMKKRSSLGGYLVLQQVFQEVVSRELNILLENLVSSFPPRELDNCLRFESEETMLQMQQALVIFQRELQLFSSPGLFCHAPLKRENEIQIRDRERRNDASNAIGSI